MPFPLAHSIFQLPYIHLNRKRARCSAVYAFDRNDILIIPSMSKLDIPPVHFNIIGRIEAQPARTRNMCLHPGMGGLFEVRIAPCRSPTKWYPLTYRDGKPTLRQTAIIRCA